MARLFATILSVLTMLGLGIVALQYRVDELDGAGLAGNDAEAFDLAANVTGNLGVILGNAMPRLLAVVFLVFVLVLLLLTR